MRQMQGHRVHTKQDKHFQYLPVFVVALCMHGIHFICIFIQIEGPEVRTESVKS